jgi:protein-S-isoprenylcysteine O-methyltransferase Ste14
VSDETAAVREDTALRRIGRAILAVLSVFVILEPIWMLLPFAGFLYGSVLHIQTLSRSPSTAWLTHFVFPVLTLGWLGPALVLLGLGVFLVGAVQIYTAKIRRSGLVMGGLYRFVRHPQYTALVFFSVGILLTWGRAIAFVAFFAMMFLYFHLARSEERRCRRLFGAAYDAYAEKASFVLPGDRVLRGLGARMPRIPGPAPLRFLAGVVLTALLCLGSYHLIRAVKSMRLDVPYLTATVEFATAGEIPDLHAETVNGIPFILDNGLAVARGPYRNAAAPAFAERVHMRLHRSKTLAEFLSFLAEPTGDVAVVFALPFSAPDSPGPPGDTGGERRGPPVDPAGPERVRLLIFRCSPVPGASLVDVLADTSKRTIRGACIAPVNLGRPEGDDLVEGTVVRPGPMFPGENRWRHVHEQFAARGDSASTAGDRVLVPGASAGTTLVLVKAPILKLRRQPAFADEVLDRLMASAAFRDRLRAVGAGPDAIPVAFPRPGPGWYRDHDDRPRVSVFVMLVRPTGSEDTEKDLFRPGGSEILGAFTAELDLSVEHPRDPVGETVTIGPRRDLDERWRFFLSGL